MFFGGDSADGFIIRHNVDDLQKFYDRYCKDVQNDWESTAPVRLTMISFTGKDVVERAEQEVGTLKRLETVPSC